MEVYHKQRSFWKTCIYSHDSHFKVHGLHIAGSDQVDKCLHTGLHPYSFGAILLLKLPWFQSEHCTCALRDTVIIIDFLYSSWLLVDLSCTDRGAQPSVCYRFLQFLHYMHCVYVLTSSLVRWVWLWAPNPKVVSYKSHLDLVILSQLLQCT